MSLPDLIFETGDTPTPGGDAVHLAQAIYTEIKLQHDDESIAHLGAALVYLLGHLIAEDAGGHPGHAMDLLNEATIPALAELTLVHCEQLQRRPVGTFTKNLRLARGRRTPPS